MTFNERTTPHIDQHTTLSYSDRDGNVVEPFSSEKILQVKRYPDECLPVCGKRGHRSSIQGSLSCYPSLVL